MATRRSHAAGAPGDREEERVVQFSSSMKHALVTGGAGFIGSHLVDSLLADGWRVTVFDNFDPFYDRAIKDANVRAHRQHPAYTLVRGDLRDAKDVDAPAGSGTVRRDRPPRGACRRAALDRGSGRLPGRQRRPGRSCCWSWPAASGTPQFVFASSSSVYGINPRVPWREEDHVLQPISPYASTKVSGELLGHVYSHLYGIRFVALRFFTVYGPRQRPDLAIHKFARLMLAGKPIPVFGDGTTSRDYTFIDDVVRGVRAAMDYDGLAVRGDQSRQHADGHACRDDRRARAGARRVGAGRAASRAAGRRAADVGERRQGARAARFQSERRPIDEGVARFAAWLRATSASLPWTP